MSFQSKTTTSCLAPCLRQSMAYSSKSPPALEESRESYYEDAESGESWNRPKPGNSGEVTVIPPSDDDSTPKNSGASSTTIRTPTPFSDATTEKLQTPFNDHDTPVLPVAGQRLVKSVIQPSFNVTSTPMLSHSNRIPLVPLDASIIEEEEEAEHLNFTCQGGKSRTVQNISISSDDENSTEMRAFFNKENLKGGRKLFQPKEKVKSPNEFMQLVDHVEKLQIDAEKKKFDFKSRSELKGQAVNATPKTKPRDVYSINSDESDQDDGANDKHAFSFEDSDNDVVHLSPKPSKRLVVPNPARKLMAPPRTEMEQLSIEEVYGNFGKPQSSARPPPSADIAAYHGDVKKAINYLSEAIENIPREEDVQVSRPHGLKVDLYSHQNYGLEWLCWREGHYPGGGILADEMGLGKTIMIIALILRTKYEKKSEAQTGSEAKTQKADSSWKFSSQKSKLVPSNTTLIIVPPSVIHQWENEITQKSPKLRKLIYHGPKRTTSPAVLVQNDIVLSTYETVRREIPKEGEEFQRDKQSPLLRVNWERIVLDEGHIIRNSGTNAASALCRLEASHRWVVTGTPVHNKPADMHSLVKFLRLKPFDDSKAWDHWIGLKAVLGENATRLNTIGKALILRRTKQEISESNTGGQKIPPKFFEDVHVQMSEMERTVYDKLMEFASENFKLFLKNQEQRVEMLQAASAGYIAGRKKDRQLKLGSKDVQFSTILVLFLRLRQASVLPYLIQGSLEDEDSNLQADEEFDPFNDEIFSRRNPVFSENFESAKLKQLFEDLNELKREAKEEGRPMEKVVIVSQWTTLLNIIHGHLKEKGFKGVTMISGEVAIADRQDIVDRFNNLDSKRYQILLLSLTAGGVGLNLVGANHMIFLDMHYNPQLELQAQGRIHRFGQTRNCHIRRYISSDTMDVKLLEIQKIKMDLAEGLLSESKKKSGPGLSIQDMRVLFGL